MFRLQLYSAICPIPDIIGVPPRLGPQDLVCDTEVRRFSGFSVGAQPIPFRMLLCQGDGNAEIVMTGYPIHCVRQQCDLCPTSVPLLRLKLLQSPLYVLISRTVSFPNVPLFVLRFMLVCLSNSLNWNHEIIFTMTATCQAHPYILVRV